VARPRQFDPEEVLDRAIQLFWRKGYDGTSVQEIVDQTGVNRFSLYSAFGDKRALFLAACERYRRLVVTKRLESMERSQAGIAAIRGFFTDLIDLLASERGWRGCLMTNATVEVAPHDGEAAQQSRAYLERMNTAFHAVLMRARARGEIGARQSLNDYARYLTTVVQGLAVVAKVSRDPRELQGIVKAILGGLE
jgi:TetR/AcrR family transcriptional repressor of nem operon